VSKKGPTFLQVKKLAQPPHQINIDPQNEQMTSIQGPLDYMCGMWGLKNMDESLEDAPMFMCESSKE
jgi:hypothetical protein